MALTNLEDVIYERMQDVDEFSIDMVMARLPNNHEQAIRRAVARLVHTQRVRVLRRADHGRLVYTAMGTSSLPLFRNKDGKVYPISALLPVMAELHDERGRLKALEVLDDTWQIVMRLFVTAQSDDQQLIRRDRNYALNELAEKRGFLLRMVGNIDAVMNHPAMQNNEAFKKAFEDDIEAPAAEELLRFRRWLVEINANERTE